MIKISQDVPMPSGSIRKKNTTPTGTATQPKQNNNQPQTNSKPVQPQQKKPTQDSPDKKSVRDMQNAILRVKEGLENLEIGNPQDVGGYDRGQKFETTFNHGEEIEMGSNDPRQINRDPSSFKRNQFQNQNKQNESLDGTNPVGNFLLNNYIKQWGLQYSDLDVDQSHRNVKGQGAMDIKNFKALVDTIGHIGSPKPERKKTREEDILQAQLDSIEKRHPPKEQDLYNQMQNEIADFTAKAAASPSANEDYIKNEIAKINQKYKYKMPITAQYQATQNKLTQLSIKLDKEYYSKLGEESTDGVWSIRTNNALKNIASIINGLVAFSKDMGIQLKTYKKEFVEKLSQEIPKTPEQLKPEDKINKSKVISEILEYFYTTLLTEIKNSVLQSKQVAQFANQTKSFVQFNTMKSKEEYEKNTDNERVSANQAVFDDNKQRSGDVGNMASKYLNAYKDSFNAKEHIGMVVNFGNKQIPIKFSNLMSVADLSNLYKLVFNRTPNNKLLKSFVAAIKQQIQQSPYYQASKNPPQQMSQQEVSTSNQNFQNTVNQQNQDEYNNKWNRYNNRSK